jgi:hypothetical protein
MLEFFRSSAVRVAIAFVVATTVATTAGAAQPPVKAVLEGAVERHAEMLIACIDDALRYQGPEGRDRFCLVELATASHKRFDIAFSPRSAAIAGTSIKTSKRRVDGKAAGLKLRLFCNDAAGQGPTRLPSKRRTRHEANTNG